MTDQEAAPTYMIFIIVFCFFITGLLGFIFCHMLKDRGYRCRTGEPEDEEQKDTLGIENHDEENEDTVERILKCIIENEANMEAFNEMLGNQTPPPARHNLRFLRKESVWSIPTHHHTIHMGDLNFCHHCGHGHAKKAQCRTHMIRTKSRPGEQTVLSVGRFRVTHMEKKSPPDSTNVTVSDSRDHPDLLVPLDGKTELQDGPMPNKERYDIRNMFKGVEAANATGPHPSKPKKRDSLSFVRRGSDAVGRRGDAVRQRSDSIGQGSDAAGRDTDAVGQGTDAVGRDSDTVSQGNSTVGRGGDAVGRDSDAVIQGGSAMGRVSDTVVQYKDAVGGGGDAVERDDCAGGRGGDDVIVEENRSKTERDIQPQTSDHPAPDNCLNSDFPENNPQ